MYIHAQTSLQVDPSVAPTPLPLQSGVGVGDQVLFDTGALASAKHTVTVTVSGTPGAQSANGAKTVGISGFDYLASANANAVKGCTA